MWIRWFSTALVCAVFCATHGSTSTPPKSGNEFVDKWKAIESNAKSLVQKLISMSYREALPLIHEADLSSECFISLTSVLRGLQELNTDVVRREYCDVHTLCVTVRFREYTSSKHHYIVSENETIISVAPKPKVKMASFL